MTLDSTPAKTPFHRFAVRHEAVNRWLRATEMSYYYALFSTEIKDAALRVSSLFPKRRRPDDSLRRYGGRLIDGNRSRHATIGDFRKDISDGLQRLFESTIVEEVGALELFLRDWTLAAMSDTLAGAAGTLPRATILSLSAFRDELVSDPRRSVSLAKVGALFPAVRSVLESTTHKRAERPLLFRAAGQLNCRTVAELWREVRNLLLHHDRVVHVDFATRFGNLWLALQTEAASGGALVQPRRAVAGQRLPVVLRHVIFCMTSCYQTAVVFHVASGGTMPANVPTPGLTGR